MPKPSNAPNAELLTQQISTSQEIPVLKLVRVENMEGLSVPSQYAWYAILHAPLAMGQDLRPA